MHLAFAETYSADTCKRKYRFVTQGRARQVILRMLDQGKIGLSSYRCHYCHGWHIGRTPKLEVKLVP